MVVLTSGFETGDFSEWTASVGTPTVVHTPVHHGGHAMSTDALTDLVYKAVGLSEVYMAGYVRWTTNPDASKPYFLLWMGLGYGSTRVTGYVTNDSGTIKWGLKGGGSALKTFATPNPTVDTWYFMEIYHKRNTAQGNSLWIDGNLLGTCTGTSDNIDIAYAMAGTEENVPSGGVAYHDCITIDTAYINPEAASGIQLFLHNMGY